MRQKINQVGLSRFTLGFLGFYLAGIFFGNFLAWPYYYFLILAAALIFGAYVYYHDKIILLVFVALIGLALGLANFRYFDGREQIKKINYGQTEIITAVVETSSNKNNLQQIVAKYRSAASGTKILIQAPLYPAYKYGDKLLITGQIENPAGIIINGFDYGNYLQKKQIRGMIKNPEKIDVVGWRGSKIVAGILKIGDQFQASIQRVLPEPLSTVMIGLLIGLHSQLPDSITTAFQRTGLTHLTAVSGYNVTIMIIGVAFLLSYISRRAVLGGTILATIIFIILCGAGASVLRAGILAIIIVLAKAIGRKVYYPILILLVADIMLAFNPYALKNDVSFQLSFLAFAGLLTLSAAISLHRYLQFIPQNIRQILSETLGAQILVLPILVYNFGVISLVAPITNILILPLVPAAMLVGFLTGIAGLIWLKLGYLFGFASWLMVKYILIVVQGFSSLPWAAITFQSAQWFWIPLYYILIVIWLRYQKVKTQNE